MRTVSMMAMALGLAVLGLTPAGAEIVERELGTDAEGNAVSGYVFQGGREFRGSARRSRIMQTSCAAIIREAY